MTLSGTSATLGPTSWPCSPSRTATAPTGSWLPTAGRWPTNSKPALGYVDDDGYLYFVDRQKDIVRRGGENLSTIEVETALRTHPAVGDIAVVARPDPVLGETVAAFIVVAEGYELPAEDDLRAHTEGTLAPYKVPTTIQPIEELPRTGNGKVEKFRLRQRFT